MILLGNYGFAGFKNRMLSGFPQGIREVTLNHGLKLRSKRKTGNCGGQVSLWFYGLCGCAGISASLKTRRYLLLKLLR